MNHERIKIFESLLIQRTSLPRTSIKTKYVGILTTKLYFIVSTYILWL